VVLNPDRKGNIVNNVLKSMKGQVYVPKQNHPSIEVVHTLGSRSCHLNDLYKSTLKFTAMVRKEICYRN